LEVRRAEGGRRKEEGGRRKEEGGRRKEEGVAGKEEGVFKRGGRGPYLFYVIGCFSRGFEEGETVLSSKLLPLLRCHCSFAVQIYLVANQHDYNVLIRILPAILQPRREMFKRLSS
jgi:hypothetical protein